MSGGQYGEDKIVLKFFEGQETGLVVDIGAANGIDNSNSYCLLQNPNWAGVLVEPEPEQFAALQKLYEDRPLVSLRNCACGPEAGTGSFFCGGQVSTLDLHWRDRCIEIHNIDYKEIEVEIRTPDELLSDRTGIDFLTIDAEGWDLKILDALNLDLFQPRLICLEGRTIPENLVVSGYHVHVETRGNIFFARGDQ